MLAVTVDAERSVDIARQRLPAMDADLVLIENKLVTTAAGLLLIWDEVRVW
jgi:hypothetical protein